MIYAAPTLTEANLFLATERESLLQQMKKEVPVFACAVTCIDGRTHPPLLEVMKKMFGVDYVDRVTEPGPNLILAQDKDEAIVANIKKRVGISIENHHAGVIAIVGHHGCSGNPAGKEEQLQHMRQAKKTVQSWNFGVAVVLFWIPDGWKEAEQVW